MSTYSWPSFGSASGGGTVTSVGLADGSISPIYNISGSPVTTAGTLTFTLQNQNANLVFAGPSTGAAAQPSFRALVAADLPAGVIVSLGAFGSSPNASGASVAAQTLTLQPANATNPGGVSIGAQTFAGVKTFSSPPNFSSLTASQALVLDGSKNVSTLPYSTSNVINSLVERDGTGLVTAQGFTGFSLNLNGATSGIVSVLPQAVTGTFNFNLPVTAGTSGFLLSSGGGGASAMTWTDPATFQPALSGLTTNGAIYSASASSIASTAVGTQYQSLVSNGGGTPPSFQAIALDQAAAVSGVLPIARGGTNNGSLAVTAGGVIYTDGTQLVNVGAGTSGQYLTSNGASPPSWTSASGGSVTVNSFTGDGSTVAFILSTNPGTLNNTQVYLSGVYQEKSTYSVAGISLTFSTAPPNGVSIQVVIGATIPIGTIPNGSVTYASLAPSFYVAPTIQRFTSGSGTYNPPIAPRSPLYIVVEMVGGGGGGLGAGTSTNGGTAGGSTTFGTNTCSGGSGAPGTTGGDGGSSVVGLGTILASVAGAPGHSGTSSSSSGFTLYAAAGNGGNSFYGGAGLGPTNPSPTAGGNAAANSGSGGGGGSGPNLNGSGGASGAGGGAGGYTKVLISSPSSYAYSVGAGGSGGAAGASGGAGGNGGSGVIVVTEYYQ